MFWTIDVVGTYVLVLTLATLLVLVLVLRKNSETGGVPMWLGAGLFGILLGGAASAALVKGLGYNVVHVGQETEENAAPAGPSRNATVSATSSGSISRLTACGARMTSSSTRSSGIPCACAWAATWLSTSGVRT